MDCTRTLHGYVCAIKWTTLSSRVRNMTHRNKLLSAFGLGVFAAVVLLVLSAYLNPAMLINLANLRLCT